VLKNDSAVRGVQVLMMEKTVFEKCRIRPEKGRTIGVYEGLYFKDIFPEDELEKYLRKLEKIWNKSEKYNSEVDSTGDDLSLYTWVYTQKVPYFLGDNKNMEREINGKS